MGVHMLHGDDLAGGQVDMCTVLCEKPVIDETMIVACVEYRIDIVKPIEYTICDAEFQVN